MVLVIEPALSKSQGSHYTSVFRIVRPESRAGRTAGGSPSFFESKDGVWDMELGPGRPRALLFRFSETSCS